MELQELATKQFRVEYWEQHRRLPTMKELREVEA